VTDSSLDILDQSTAAAAAVPDEVCAAAVELARSAALEVAGPALIGEHLGVEADGDRIVTHFFASTDRAYVGWRWSVTVVRAPRSKTVTVDEVVLLPGPQALRAPEWVPWSERLQAGDLGVGDVLPTAADDERLVPGYAGVGPHDEIDDVDTIEAVAHELWLGRPRVLSLHGRDEAAERWYGGDHGPQAPIARAADLSCASCGFLVLMRGALSRVFGVCANEYAPDDGRVVSFDHGCGAHSEALVVHTAPQGDADVPAIQEPPADALSADELSTDDAREDRAHVAESLPANEILAADESLPADEILPVDADSF
jgi:hypothetical protein